MPTDLSIIIPTAGLGRRLKTFGPKALIQLRDGRSLLRRQVDTLRAAFPDADVVVVVGYEAEKVARVLPASVRVVENENYETTGAARSVAMGLRAAAASRSLVVYGDLLFNRRAVEALPLDRSCVLVDGRDRATGAEVGVTSDGGLAVHFDYGLPNRWLGVALLHEREARLFRDLGNSRPRRKYLGHEVLNEVVEQGGEIVAVSCPKARVMEVDTTQDIARAKTAKL